MKTYVVTFQRVRSSVPNDIQVIRVVDVPTIFKAESRAWDLLFKLHRSSTHEDWFKKSIVEEI